MHTNFGNKNFDSHKIDADATAGQVVDALGVSFVLLAFCNARNSFSMGGDFWEKSAFRVICFPVKKVRLRLARHLRHLPGARGFVWVQDNSETMQAMGPRATFRLAVCFKATQALRM